MLRILVAAGVALLLAGPAFADAIMTEPTQTAANQNKPKPKPKPTAEDGRTLADYNFQKES